MIIKAKKRLSSASKKYEILKEDSILTVFVVDIPKAKVKAGDLGGYVSSEKKSFSRRKLLDS